MSVKHMFVKPRSGLTVRDPFDNYSLLKETGQNKPDNTYWQRRLKAGDVVKATPPKAPKKEGNAK